MTDENQKVGLTFTDILIAFGRRASAAPITFSLVPRMLEAAFSGQKSPQQALDDLASEANRLIEEAIAAKRDSPHNPAPESVIAHSTDPALRPCPRRMTARHRIVAQAPAYTWGKSLMLVSQTVPRRSETHSVRRVRGKAVYSSDASGAWPGATSSSSPAC